MKLRISFRTPFLFNILGVGSFFVFLFLYFLFLNPFFYILNYQLFSFISVGHEKNKYDSGDFVVMPDSKEMDVVYLMKKLKKIQVEDFEDVNNVFFQDENLPLFISTEFVKKMSFSELTEQEECLDVYYKSYTIFFDKKNNSLHLKDNFSSVYSFLDNPFDKNSIDSIKMKMDKINYDFQLELERWRGRFIKKNKMVISDVIKFVKKSNMPEVLKKDVILMFGNDSIILDSESYLEELINVLENMEDGSKNELYGEELSFLRKKYAELYKIHMKDKVGELTFSVYDFFKMKNIFISDSLQLVSKRKIFVQKKFLNEMDKKTIKMKQVGKHFLILDNMGKLMLLNESGFFLKESKGSCLLIFIILTVLFLFSFLERKLFILLSIVIFCFIVLFGQYFFIESVLVFLYSVFFRRSRAR